MLSKKTALVLLSVKYFCWLKVVSATSVGVAALIFIVSKSRESRKGQPLFKAKLLLGFSEALYLTLYDGEEEEGFNNSTTYFQTE